MQYPHLERCGFYRNGHIAKIDRDSDQVSMAHERFASARGGGQRYSGSPKARRWTTGSSRSLTTASSILTAAAAAAGLRTILSPRWVRMRDFSISSCLATHLPVPPGDRRLLLRNRARDPYTADSQETLRVVKATRFLNRPIFRFSIQQYLRRGEIPAGLLQNRHRQEFQLQSRHRVPASCRATVR